MTVLVDTNILGRLAEPSHLQHPLAFRAERALRDAGHDLCIVTQNLVEFYVVATRPLQVGGLGFMPKDVVRSLNNLEWTYIVAPDSVLVYAEWKRLIALHATQGKPAHDARIVAAMNVHGIKAILTFNTADFKRYPGIEVLDPASVASAS